MEAIVSVGVLRYTAAGTGLGGDTAGGGWRAGHGSRGRLRE